MLVVFKKEMKAKKLIQRLLLRRLKKKKKVHPQVYPHRLARIVLVATLRVKQAKRKRKLHPRRKKMVRTRSLRRTMMWIRLSWRSLRGWRSFSSKKRSPSNSTRKRSWRKQWLNRDARKRNVARKSKPRRRHLKSKRLLKHNKLQQLRRKLSNPLLKSKRRSWKRPFKKVIKLTIKI